MSLSAPKKLLHRMANVPVLGAPLAGMARAYRGVCTVLMYHRVRGAESPRTHDPNRILSVDVQSFDRQMAHLRARWNPISLPAAVEGLRSGSLPERAVAVTFDDGYLDNLEQALPVLHRHGVPATLYVTTGFVDRKASPWWEELEWITRDRPADFATEAARLRLVPQEQREREMARLRLTAGQPYPLDREVLTWEQVATLARDPLITLGAHTVTHPVLAAESAETVRREMLESRQVLEKKIGKPFEHFAYPYGGAAQCGPREFEIAAEAGFASAVTTRPGHWFSKHSHHLHALPRVMVEFGDDDESFAWKLSGLDSAWQSRGRRFVTF